MTRLPLRGLVAGLTLLSLAVALAACQETAEAPSPLETKEASATPTASPNETPAASVAATATQPARTPGPGETLWRWGNVTLLIPAGFESWVTTEPGPEGTPGVLLRDTEFVPGDQTYVLIDAENGAILKNEVREKDSKIISMLLSTLTVAPIDAASAGWPYDDDAPPLAERATAAGLSYLEPLPETGFHVYQGIGDPFCPFVGLRSAASTVVTYIDPESNSLTVDLSRVNAVDRDAIERWVATVKICGSEAQC
jgi:hypothetical protein